MYMCVWWYMCEPCQEISGNHTNTQPLLSWHGSHIYHQIHIYTTATVLTWFTHIPPITHIHNRYPPDMVHAYTTKHTYTQPLFSWHGSHIYHQTHKHTTATLLTWFTHIPPNTQIHNRYSPDMVHTYTTKHTYTQPLISWHGSHIYHQTHIYITATLLTWFTHIPPNTHIHNHYSPDICVFGGICVNHVRRVAVVYMCVWWYMCEPCQESSGCVYVCLVVYVWTMSGE
jgi:hypothetical protein